MSPIPPALARRINRLARRLHCFHRFAHHPLCQAYAEEVFQIGKVRFCRGCTLALAGALAGLPLGLLWPQGAPWVWFGVLVGAGVHRLPRRSKWLSRFLPFFSLGWSAAGGITKGGFGWFHPAAGALLLGLAWMAYRRRGPSRSPCEACPEKDLAPRCSGTREIRLRERAFIRLTAGWLNPL